MIYDDPFDDVFRMMNDLFGWSNAGSEYVESKESERIIDGDRIYWTFKLKDVNKDEVTVSTHTDYLELIISKGPADSKYVVKSPYPLLTDKTTIKYNNYMLDITAHIDMDNANIAEVKDD